MQSLMVSCIAVALSVKAVSSMHTMSRMEIYSGVAPLRLRSTMVTGQTSQRASQTSLAAISTVWVRTDPSPVLEPGFKIGEINKQGQRVWDITFWSSGGGFDTGFAIADGYLFAASNTTSNTGTLSKASLTHTSFLQL